MSDPLLTVGQLAERWGWSASKLYRLIYRKQIPAKRLPNGWYFRESEVEHWLATKTVLPAPRPPAPLPERGPTREEECARLGISVNHQFS